MGWPAAMVKSEVKIVAKSELRLQPQMLFASGYKDQT